MNVKKTVSGEGPAAVRSDYFYGLIEHCPGAAYELFLESGQFSKATTQLLCLKINAHQAGAVKGWTCSRGQRVQGGAASLDHGRYAGG